MSFIKKKIDKIFLQNIAVLENTFGFRYTPLLLLRQDRERKKRILREVYGYKDIDLIFPEEVDREALNRLVKIMFNHNETDYEIDKEQPYN